jgi:hypothetical protein
MGVKGSEFVSKDATISECCLIGLAERNKREIKGIGAFDIFSIPIE